MDNDAQNEGQNGFSMMGFALTEKMIDAGLVHESRRAECLVSATHIVADRPDTAWMLFGENEIQQKAALALLADLVISEIGEEKHSFENNLRYSSTVYADTHEELMIKKRKVDIYASLGLLSIFGFLGCFGYAIYLFFTESGAPLLWAAVGFILFMFQKWVGKKHDALTG